jgi:hypothetical protein
MTRVLLTVDDLTEVCPGDEVIELLQMQGRQNWIARIRAWSDPRWIPAVVIRGGMIGFGRAAQMSPGGSC